MLFCIWCRFLIKNAKVEQIRAIWKDGLGVVALHAFQNTIPVEAYTREACMILALGEVNYITNKKILLLDRQRCTARGISCPWRVLSCSCPYPLTLERTWDQRKPPPPHGMNLGPEVMGYPSLPWTDRQTENMIRAVMIDFITRLCDLGLCIEREILLSHKNSYLFINYYF